MVRNKHYVQVSFQECLQTTWVQKFLELQCQENPSYLSVPEKLRNVAADWHNLILTWEGFITADSISLKIRLLNKEKIKLESSSQVSNKKRRKHISRIQKYTLEDMGSASSFTKTQVEIETVSSTMKRICDLENHCD